MPMFIYEEFLVDLRDHGDTRFAKRVLSKVLNQNGRFRPDQNDHRYEGIENAWIRYVSRQNTAWRAVYLRRGDDVYLYRAGEHSIENGLGTPSANAEILSVVSTGPPNGGFTLERASRPSLPEAERDRFLQNTRGRLLRNFMLGRRLIPHREVILISPFVSLDILQRTARLGGMLEDLIEDGAKVTLATRWPTAAEVNQFEELEARGIQLIFHKSLHAKLYIFEAREKVGRFADQRFDNAAVIGSSNLTGEGFAFNERCFNEELCYELPPHDFDRALEFAAQIAHKASDLRDIRREYAKRR